MIDEEKLLFRLKCGDENALREAIKLYTPYISVVLYNCSYYGLLRQDIEEITADAFIMLWKSSHSIDLSKGTIRGYLASCVKNAALKKLNKKAENVPLEELEISDNDSCVDALSDRDVIWDAVMSLGEPDSEIFVRFYRYDQSLKAISKAMKLNLSTVKTKLSRGKKKLKQILSEEML